MSEPMTRNVVILAAGRGARFQVEGFSIPKPLITFNGATLLQHTVDLAYEISVGAPDVDISSVIVVGTSEVANAARKIPYVDEVVEVRVTQPGPAASALLAMGLIDPDSQVIFLDCDNYYPPDNRSWTQQLPVLETFIVVAEAPEKLAMTQFCNVVVNRADVRVKMMAEKTVLPFAYAATGVYGFHNARQFQMEAWNRLSEDPNGVEIPMSRLLHVAARGSHTGAVVPIFAKAWHPIGTPEQLAEAAKHVRPDQ